MSSRICYVYSDQDLTPRAIEVIKGIKDANGFADVKFELVDPPNYADRVLVFGKIPERAYFGIEWVKTYSIAQMVSKANAATVLVSALTMYFQGRHERDARVVSAKGGYASVSTKGMFAGWDFDAPTAIDIETNGNLGVTHTAEEIEVISVAFCQEGKVPVIVVGPVGDVDGRNEVMPIAGRTLTDLIEVMPRFTKAIYHNGKFDTRVLNRVLGVTLNVWFDTMLAHHVLNMAAGEHGLKALAMRYFGAPDWDSEAKKYTYKGGHYERIPRFKLKEYNGWDVYWTLQLWKLLAPQIEFDDDNQVAFEFEMAAARMLLKVEQYGIPFDVEAAEKLRRQNALNAQGASKWMQDRLGDQFFNPGSPQQVKQAFLDLWDIELSSTSEGTLVELGEKYAPNSDVNSFIDMLFLYRKAKKQNSTYVEGWKKQAREDENGQLRVHATYLVHGTSTGRLSSTRPNAQNIPREKSVRKIFGITTNEKIVGI